MRNNYTCTTVNFGSILFAFILIVFCSLPSQSVCAQAFYKTLSASQLNIGVSVAGETNTTIKSEGIYFIKDGQLDDISKLKLTLPTSLLDSVLKDKKITFEQTHVMVLPIMGMAHFVGMLDVSGVKGIVSFQLGFTVNNDQSITFKGNKLVKLDDLAKEMPKHDLMLSLDFVLKNDKNNLVALTSK